jgi:hypothetical protein
VLGWRQVLGHDGATVTDNYVHDNENVGIWADTDNVRLEHLGNYISNNYGEGVMYEISYNGLIADNTFVHNAVGEGPTNPGFPTGAIYISESGSDSRVAGPYDTRSTSQETSSPTTGPGSFSGRTPTGSAGRTARTTPVLSARSWHPPLPRCRPASDRCSTFNRYSATAAGGHSM